MTSPIRAGDTVKIKPEWQDKGDVDLHFVARCDEQDGCVKISAIELKPSSGSLWPWQLVEASMIEVTK